MVHTHYDNSSKQNTSPKKEVHKNKIKVHLKSKGRGDLTIKTLSPSKIFKQEKNNNHFVLKKNQEKKDKDLVKTLSMHICESVTEKENIASPTLPIKKQSPQKKLKSQNIQFFTSPPNKNSPTPEKKLLPILQQQYPDKIKNFVKPPNTGKKIVNISFSSSISGKNPRSSQETVMKGSASNYALYHGINKDHTAGYAWLHLIANQLIAAPENIKQSEGKQSEKEKVGNNVDEKTGEISNITDNNTLISTDKNNLICGTQECNNFMRTFENDIKNLMNKKIVKNITQIDLQVEAPLLLDDKENYTHFAKKIIYRITLHQKNITPISNQDSENADVKQTDIKKTAVLKFYPYSHKKPGNERRRAMREILHELLELENKRHLTETILNQMIPETENDKSIVKELNEISNNLLSHDITKQLHF